MSQGEKRGSRADHPRPLLRRPWTSLDGPWDFSLEGPDRFDRTIEVPYAPETPASGVGVGRVERCWYRRRVEVPPGRDGEGVRLHFGAVDRSCEVFADGALVASHEGGYGAFTAELIPAADGGEVEVLVAVADDAGDLDAPRGKQDWAEVPHAIWYPRTTGIWRTPWLERVAATRIGDVAWDADLDATAVRVAVRIDGPVRPGLQLAVRLHVGGTLVAEDRCAVLGADVERTIRVGDGGIDDQLALLWWPRSPTLIDAELVILDADGSVVDEADSYTALRRIEVVDGRFVLNGRPYPLRLVLDQGYWPDTGATPSSTDALRRDVEATLALGFNGARKHQKVEDPRYLAWADQLGLLVWVEMPSAYRFSPLAASRLLREWADVVTTTRNHPSVIAWVPINESWGVPALERDRRHRGLVDALAAAAHALDGTRPVSANDGWETAGGEIVGIHDYTQEPDVLFARYGTTEAVDAVLTGRRFDGKRADLDARPAAGRAVVLSEFGGVALADDTGGEAWGYTTASSPDDLLRRYREQWAAVHASEALAGACWTQLTDTYQEVNGLLRADRSPKVPVSEIAAATRDKER